MASAKDIGWSSYREYEGPFFRGSTKIQLSPNPSEAEKFLHVILATESGGHVDAINMYDRCILTAGLIQWCEGGQYSVSDMLGHIVSQSGLMPEPFWSWLDGKASFKRNEKGRWRFWTVQGEVDTIEEQKRLFLLRSNGLKGSWDAESREYAKGWAAAVANTLALPEAHAPQVAFTSARLMGFVMPEAKSIFWPDDRISSTTAAWRGATQAAYLSFAANLPAVANNHLKKALANTTAPKWSPDWCITILKQLTFGPQIAIYPARYNAIRPVIERLYGVDLPDFAADLQKWEAQMGIDPRHDAPAFTSVKDIQGELIAEGYDLGPTGADGKYGPKTREAILTFQGLHGLVVDGIVGPKTRKALVAEWLRRN